MKKAKAAISTSLSSIILAGVLLGIVGTASYAANNAINSQIEEAQFEQAENIMLSLDKIVKNIMFSPGSSGYIRANFQSMTPQFSSFEENIKGSIESGKLADLVIWKEDPFATLDTLSKQPLDPATYVPDPSNPIISWKYSHWGYEFEAIKAFLGFARHQHGRIWGGD